MNKEKFETLCRSSKAKPERKITIPQGEIYIGLGKAFWHEDMIVPHEFAIWAVSQGEDNMVVAQKLYFKTGESKEVMLMAAEQVAAEHLNAGG